MTSTKFSRLLFHLSGLFCLLLTFSFQLAVARADSPRTLETTNKPLRVGVKLAPPFVMQNDGQYDGLAVDLWEEAARANGWTWEYEQYELDDLLDAVSAHKVDVGLGAITATAERERRMDFAHPIISSGLGVAVRSNQRSGWLAVLQAFLSPAFLKIIGVLILLLFSVGLLAWLFERKANPDQFGGHHRQGIFAGFWWAMVTMTTVGYGDLAPRSVGGRVVGMVWMLAALMIVSFFTASITSALTVGQLSHRISSADDLASAKIASIAATTSGDWLDRRNIEYEKAADLDAALTDLAKGRVDVVVYDAPLLRWEIRSRYRNSLRILPLLLERQDYAFALPEMSSLREPLDASLLQAINSPDWNARVAEYLGDTD
ncbi:MAG TPA: transporter substrate-binding domain-containing protein [Dokdonella sp.]|uniref:transporter substrate-binding domain-containing protein n=1 Tax=Dokdonella sp. TaxID=2291710 RepID=UPI002D80E9F4|nr:transporter substrate-binding domain-containing protein [Dokdonella sp.]HET9033187.1 transporter substrate-binding domain-containing protein [Dokdonella sp.]